MSHKKFGPDRFSRFDVYWIQTNKQTNRQAKFIYRLPNMDIDTKIFMYPNIFPSSKIFNTSKLTS